MVNYDDPNAWADKARQLRNEAKELEDEKREARSRGESFPAYKQSRIYYCEDEAARDEQVVRNMRYGQSPTNENQSSMNQQAKRFGAEFDTR
jgi:hypothetical protein